MFAAAPVSFVLRAWQRDGDTLKDLDRRLAAVVRDFCGPVFAATHDRAISVTAETLYLLITLVLVRGGRTLGQESADLLPVGAALASAGSSAVIAPSRAFTAVSTRQRVVVCAAHVIVPLLLRRLASHFFPEREPSETVRRCMLAHIAWFWIFGARGAADTVAHRIAGVRLATLSPTGGSASGQYPFLGTLMLVRLAVELVQYFRLRRRSAAAASAASTRPQLQSQPTGPAAVAAEVATEAAGSAAAPIEANTGVCALCLEPRVNPAAIDCGHVFCWSCVAAVVDSAPASSGAPARGGASVAYNGARCPLCREPLRAESVVPLRNMALLEEAA